jgi:predicted RNase H-like nuclease (RuvC/YqgF family)
VEKALKREIALMDSEDLTPENMANKLNATAKEIAETRATLESQLAEPLAELADLRTRLESVGDGTDKETKKKRKDLEKQINKIEKDIANPYSQLQNTIKIQEMANERRNQFLESIGQQPIAMLDNTGASETLASLASAGGGAFVNTQVINNTYNNQFVQNSRNNWNSGQVIVDNMTSGSGEQVALG